MTVEKRLLPAKMSGTIKDLPSFCRRQMTVEKRLLSAKI
jgi:hypothetical protein